jgi:V/A-type H+-transporting ATPase subunit K
LNQKFEVFIIRGRTKFYCLLVGLQFLLVLIVVFSVSVIHSAAAQTASISSDQAQEGSWIAMASAISVIVCVLGAAVAIKTTGTAAISALSENEAGFFKAFLVVALAEALAVYGVIVAILLWTKIP